MTILLKKPRSAIKTLEEVKEILLYNKRFSNLDLIMTHLGPCLKIHDQKNNVNVTLFIDKNCELYNSELLATYA